MQRLNAIDAIAPAWNHTQRLLAGGRNWRLLFKVCAVAFFAQLGATNINFPGRQIIPPSHHASAATAILAGFLLLIGLAVLVIGLILFYIGSRLQFVLFEIVVRQDTWVGPIWRRYGRVVWRWIGLKVLFLVVAIVCALPFLLPAILHLVHSPSFHGEVDPQNPGAVLATLLPFLAVILALSIPFVAAYLLLLDFGLPSLALEDAPMGEAVRRIGRLIRQEPGQVALYVLMRFLLGLAWAIAGEVAIGVAMLILLVPFGGLALVLFATLHHGGPGAHAAMIAGWVVLGAILAVILILAFVVVFGACYTFLTAYSVYFLGGRYPLLGNFLEPGPGAPFTPPPPPPSPEEREDRDGGPSLPMNPAIA